RPLQPVISTIVMLRLFARRQRTSMSAYFTNSLTAPTALAYLASLRGGFPSVGQRVARSLPERWPAVLPRAWSTLRFKDINSRTGEGQPGRCPFLIGSGTWTPSRAILFCSPLTSTSYSLIAADTPRVMFSDMSPDLSCTH